eukprot:3445595-Alexandrium_andersonii.AAC.1
MDHAMVWSNWMALAGRFHNEVHAFGNVRAIPKLGNYFQLAACRVGDAAHGFPAGITSPGVPPHED